MRIPELLVPASSLEVLQVAVIFGADAVYIGGEAFGLRAKAKNFSKEDMSEGVRMHSLFRIRESIRSQKKYVLRSNVTLVLRQITPIMVHTSFGIRWEPSEW